MMRFLKWMAGRGRARVSPEAQAWLDRAAWREEWAEIQKRLAADGTLPLWKREEHGRLARKLMVEAVVFRARARDISAGKAA